jgi:hypothetical protein
MNSTMETMIIGIRPKICDNEANDGWNTVEASRKDVPDQKASIAVPCRASAIFGKATDMLVPSRATMRVNTHNETNARMSRVLGFHASAGGGCSGFVDDSELEELELGRGAGSSCAFVASGVDSFAISKVVS